MTGVGRRTLPYIGKIQGQGVALEPVARPRRGEGPSAKLASGLGRKHDYIRASITLAQRVARGACIYVCDRRRGVPVLARGRRDGVSIFKPVQLVRVERSGAAERVTGVTLFSHRSDHRVHLSLASLSRFYVTRRDGGKFCAGRPL